MSFKYINDSVILTNVGLHRWEIWDGKDIIRELRCEYDHALKIAEHYSATHEIFMPGEEIPQRDHFTAGEQPPFKPTRPRHKYIHGEVVAYTPYRTETRPPKGIRRRPK